MSKRYWLSWYEKSEDHRPLKYPPGKNILGWWCSGYRGDGESKTMVALVKAGSESIAWLHVERDWPQPQGMEQRFCNEVSDNWRPSDRFPIADWMKPRIERNARDAQAGGGE